MSEREKEIQGQLESQRETWVETVKLAADRLGSLVGPSASDVDWLASLVGKLAMQASHYQIWRKAPTFRHGNISQRS
jgi:hypothetical protein